MVVTREKSRGQGGSQPAGRVNRGGGGVNRGGRGVNRGGRGVNRRGGGVSRGGGVVSPGGILTQGGGVVTRGGGVLTRGGGVSRVGRQTGAVGGGRQTGAEGGGKPTAALARGKAKAVDASTSQAPPPHSSGEGTARDGVPEKLPPVVEDGSTSRSQRHNAGDDTATTPRQRPRSSGGDGGSSQCSNPRRRTSDSQATVSRTTSIPQQYRASANRLPFAALTSQAPSNHQSPNINLNRDPLQEAHQFDQPEAAAFDNEDEEYDEDEGEELDGEEHQAEENEAEGLEGYHVPAVGGDDQQLLDNILALPGRDRLPLLIEVPKPDTYW